MKLMWNTPMGRRECEFATVFLVVLGLSVWCFGCHRPTYKLNSGDDDWQPNTRILEMMSERGSRYASFAHDVENFYNNVHLKNWLQVYNQCDKNFADGVSSETYVKNLQKSSWFLINYEVLPPVQTVIGGSNIPHEPSKLMTICKFVEGPNSSTEYNSIIWSYDGGVWRPNCVGPITIPSPMKM